MEGVREGRSVMAQANGFTFVGLLLSMVLISILAAIAQPTLHRALVRGRAADVVEELNVLKTALLSYRADQNEWPLDQSRGTIPPGLEDYLPEGFSFRSPGYVLDYDDWSRMGDPPFDITLSFISADGELGLAVMDRLGSNVWSDGGSKYTWVIEG
jgi:type II secretory pathway pseudopilin PulG